MSQKSRRRVEIIKSGRIRGDLSGIGPMVFIGIGGTAKMVPDNSSGVFTIGRSLGPGTAFLTGMLLPLSRCRHEGIREVLLSLRDIMDEGSLCQKAEEAIVPLSRIQGYSIRPLLTDRSMGALSLESSRDCLKMLCDHFEYVSQVSDDPDGEALPLSHSRFKWPTSGQLMEQIHSGLEPRFGSWEMVKIHLLYGGLEGVGFLDFFRLGTQVFQPGLMLTDHFRLRADIRPADMMFESRVLGPAYGEFTMHIGEVEATMFLSDVFPPYSDLIRWLQDIECSKLPVRVELEEEGPNSYLEAHPTGDDDLMFLVYGEKFDNDITIQSVIDRRLFVEGFRNELSRFIKGAYDPARGEGEYWSDVKLELGRELLNNLWLHASSGRRLQ